MYLDYCIRTTPDKWGEVIEFGLLLGVIQQDEDLNVSVVQPGIWDYIGPIYVQTGVDLDGFPVMGSLKDSEGAELVHANLTTLTNLRERALELVTAHPELGEAMSRLGDYFLLDEAGNARLPSSPHRVVFR